MSKTETTKTNWVAIVLLIIVLFATAFGALCYFDDGFKDKIFGKPDSATGKELVSTTIVNETYGTFELSANSMILNYMEIQRDLLFENGTNFNYLVDETIALFNSFNLSDPLVKEDCVVGILANTGTSGKFMSDGSVTMWRDTYFKLPNNVLIYPTDGVPTD